MYHLLPNALPPALVQATLTLGWGILDTAGLSFLGVGIRPPTAEWGVLVADGTQYINSGQWWISVFPGIAILIAVLGFNLVGEWVRMWWRGDERWRDGSLPPAPSPTCGEGETAAPFRVSLSPTRGGAGTGPPSMNTQSDDCVPG